MATAHGRARLGQIQAHHRQERVDLRACLGSRTCREASLAAGGSCRRGCEGQWLRLSSAVRPGQKSIVAEQLLREIAGTFGASAAPRRSLVQGARRGSRKAGAHLAVSSTGRRPRTRSVQVRLSEAKLVASTSERRSVLSGTDAAPRHLLNGACSQAPLAAYAVRRRRPGTIPGGVAPVLL